MILSLVAVLAGPGVFAQRNVTGTVTSASNGTAIGGASVQVKGTSVQEFTDHKGYYEIQLPASATTLVISKAGFESREVVVGRQSVVNVALVEESSMPMLEMMAPPGYSKLQRESYVPATGAARYDMTAHPVYNTEEYEGLEENVFHGVSGKPLSTFSIDVDVASYANLRRFINHGQRPPAEAVRIEEMINYFSYDYPEPANGKPFSVHTEIGVAPWNEKHHLVRIGLQARRIETEYLPPANLVFLIDVSGSMQHPSKLPLVKQSFRLLLDQLRDQDHVSIVTYASGTRENS
jgi:Ca-activated chloride channel family protein